jgi:pimeloyl-ACP methyl ester carboxylesterase
MHVAEAGSGEPVLLLHGFPQHWWECRKIIPGLASPALWSANDVDAYIAQLREPDRAQAASALYRRLVLPEMLRIIRGTYRKTRLRTPTLLLFGAADSAFPPPLTNHLLRSYRAYADHVEVAFVPEAAHFIADENRMP